MPKIGGGFCKKGKENKGVNGRCVKKCTKYQKRKNGVGPCKTVKKKDHVMNRLTMRLVKKDGPTGQWVLGKRDRHPSTGKKGYYADVLARKRRG